MRGLALRRVFVPVVCLMVLAAGLFGQQVTVSTPYHSVSEGFFENMGTSWGLNGPNWSFSFGGNPTPAAPQFGRFDPSAGANFGFAGPHGWFAGNFSQGNRRSFVSQTPSVTLTNGYPGFVADASVTPFVVSYVPIVGSFPRVGPPGPIPPAMIPTPGSSGAGHDAVLRALDAGRTGAAKRQRLQDATPAEAAAAQLNRPARPMTAPNGANSTAPHAQAPTGPTDGPSARLAAARTSSAGRPAPSVAEARRIHAAEEARQNEAARKYVELARNAEAGGKTNVAKVYYQNAARQASGALRDQVLARIEALSSPDESR